MVVCAWKGGLQPSTGAGRPSSLAPRSPEGPAAGRKPPAHPSPCTPAGAGLRWTASISRGQGSGGGIVKIQISGTRPRMTQKSAFLYMSQWGGGDLFEGFCFGETLCIRNAS